MEGNANTPSGPPAQKRFKMANGGAKRRQPQYSADIVFTSKGGTIQTIPSLTKQLKGITEPIIGLQFVWEYRSPSKAVPPHYQCKLCQVTRLQNDMLAHIKGWKHGFRYMKRNHPDKVPYEEEAAVKDPGVRKSIKDMAAEVERTEDRGQLRVILKEPSEVAAFQGLRSAIPKMAAPAGPGMGPRGPPLGGRFPEPLYPGDFPPQGGLLPDYPMGGRGDLGMGGYPDPPLIRSTPGQAFSAADMGPRRFPDDGQRVGGGADGFGLGCRREGFGMGGLLGEAPGRRYPEEFRGVQSGSDPVDRPGLMGAAPEGSNLPSTLLKYLDSFRIENESDAQIVLKVTQKLTDVLMEYRLRSVSSGPSLTRSSPMTSMGGSFSSSSRMPSSNDRFSASFSGNTSGPSRYSDGPSRFYN
ncbi:uncharacterized protein si:ch211-197h24.6 [Hypomesus transpacificus]|uniref:uncharacterized protein si:ch211-197h24.6 n=1 Tax=Hypomesus transpacificus TaxID=137520 RepID=UPI001F074601|nr:uncharacterized protein si:ch211-197h24.6 [Hypomesus transpacificus]